MILKLRPVFAQVVPTMKSKTLAVHQQHAAAVLSQRLGTISWVHVVKQQIKSVTIVEAVIMQLVSPLTRRPVFAQVTLNGMLKQILADAQQQLQLLFNLTEN
jgi:hypothetical protein